MNDLEKRSDRRGQAIQGRAASLLWSLQFEKACNVSVYLIIFLFSNFCFLVIKVAGWSPVHQRTHTHTHPLSHTLTPLPATANRAMKLLAAAIPGLAFWQASSHLQYWH